MGSSVGVALILVPRDEAGFLRLPAISVKMAASRYPEQARALYDELGRVLAKSSQLPLALLPTTDDDNVTCKGGERE
jgi:hypothetical protein